MDQLNHQIAWSLKQARLEQKLRQIDVRLQTGIHIGRIEAGKSNITLRTLVRLSNKYKRPLWELLPQ